MRQVNGRSNSIVPEGVSPLFQNRPVLRLAANVVLLPYTGSGLETKKVSSAFTIAALDLPLAVRDAPPPPNLPKLLPLKFRYPAEARTRAPVITYWPGLVTEMFVLS